MLALADLIHQLHRRTDYAQHPTSRVPLWQVPLLDRTQCLCPVSYTHLDVYKRQEIRTPLNAIVGFTNLLQDEKELTDEEKDLFRNTINKNSNLLLKLINDILELSRIESGRMSFAFDDCSLNELLEEIYQTHHLLYAFEYPFPERIPRNGTYHSLSLIHI